MDSTHIILGLLVLLESGLLLFGWKRMELFHRWNNRTPGIPLSEDLENLHKGMHSWDLESKLKTINAIIPNSEFRLFVNGKDFEIIAAGRSGFIDSKTQNELHDYTG